MSGPSWRTGIVVAVVVVLVWSGVVYMASARASSSPTVAPSVGSGSLGIVWSPSLPSIPTGAAYAPSTGTLYVFLEEFVDGSYGALAFDGNRSIGYVQLQPGDFNSTYDPANGYLYVPNYLESSVSVLSGTTTLATIPTGPFPIGSALDTANGWVYVTSQEGSDVTIVNGTSLVGSVPLGYSPGYPANIPGYPAYDPVDQEVYVPVIGDVDSLPEITVLNGTSVAAVIPTAAQSYAAEYDPADGYVYIAQTADVLPIRGTNASPEIGFSAIGCAVGEGGQMGYDPANGYVYLPCRNSDSVAIISDAAVVGSVSVGEDPTMAVYDPADGNMYVPTMGWWPDFNGTVAVISGTSLADTVYVSQAPQTVTVDPATGTVLASGLTSSVTGIGYAPMANATVAEFGLENGAQWNATVGPLTLRSTVGGTPSGSQGPALSSGGIGHRSVFQETRAKQSWTPSVVPGYRLKTHGGYVALENGPKRVAAVYVPLYAVMINETGLPSGTSWSVVVSGTTYTTSGSSLTLLLSNGTYRVRAPALAGYAAYPHPCVHVHGAPASETVVFHLRR